MCSDGWASTFRKSSRRAFRFDTPFRRRSSSEPTDFSQSETGYPTAPGERVLTQLPRSLPTFRTQVGRRFRTEWLGLAAIAQWNVTTLQEMENMELSSQKAKMQVLAEKQLTKSGRLDLDQRSLRPEESVLVAESTFFPCFNAF